MPGYHSATAMVEISSAHVCWAEVCSKAQKTSRMRSDRNPDGGGVVLHVHFVSQLPDKQPAFWLICYCLAKATHLTLVKLTTKKSCFYLLTSFPACSVSWNDSCTWASGTECILDQLCVCRELLLLMWVDTRSGKVFGAAAWSAAVGCKGSQIPSSSGI